MGGPKKKKNSSGLFDDLADGFSTGVSEQIEGVKDIASGNVSRGATRMLTGNLGMNTGGVSEYILPTETTKNRIKDEAEATANADAQALADGQIEKRKEAIRTRVNAEVALRVRQPGRSQTILTSGNSALPRANNTLLTTGTGNKNGR